jgi:ribokinase
MNRRASIVVIGSSNTDMVVRTPHIPAPGETVLGGEFMMVAGGKGANQAVAASRLGADVTFVGRVGRDVFGDRSVANIAAAGVVTKYVVRDDEAPSGVALICVGEDGENAIVVAPGANARLSPGDVDAAKPAIETCDVMAIQFETPLETVQHAIQLARELGKRIIVNPAPARSVPAGFLSGVDVITPNENEASVLLGWPAHAPFFGDRAARTLLTTLGVRAAIVTLAAKGAVVATSDRVQEIAGRRVKAVDSTAAGDCFTGALAVALAEGQDLGPAVSFANAAAAISVTRMGAQTSMPMRADVESLIRQRTSAI